MGVRRRRISQTAERLSLIFAAVLVLFIGVLAYNSWTAFRTSSDQAAVTRRVVERTNALLSSLKDAETGQRGFLLTGDERYLDPYRDAITEIPSDLQTLARLEAERRRADQAQRVETLRSLVDTELAELAYTIDLYRTQGSDAALAKVQTGRGKIIMDQIRALGEEIETSTYDYSGRESQRARASANQTGLVAVLGSAAIFTLLIFATVSIESATRRRQTLIEALEASEEQLRQSRDWLQTTLASIGDAVIATDQHGRITLLNYVAQSLTGWSNEEAQGQPLEQVFVIRNEENGRDVENPVTKVLREGRTVGLANHTQLLAKDGRSVPIDDSAAPIRGSRGQIAGVVLVFRDITARKQAEQAVQRSMQNLRAANAALSRANEDLNQFAFAASHDLQEPLRMITSYSQLLLRGYRGQLDGDAATCAEFITEGTKRMRDLLADLLAYTHLASEGQELVEPVDLNRVLQTAIENCNSAIRDAGAAVTSDWLPSVVGHQSHFLQLFQNLISNSLKYRGQQPPRVRVSSERQDGCWRIAVEDNGMGIAPEYHKQIFGVFKRLHDRTIPGTGMGLAICQRVVNRYGGQIWVESQVDRGATFYFTLPVTENGAVAHEA